jgi:protein involved in polysaccharide export with SLBB domain
VEIYAEIKGMVFYPDVYEILPDETVAEIIRRAGGLRPEANESRIEIARVNAEGSIGLVYLDLKQADQFPLHNSDVVSIRSSLENKPMVLVEGALYGVPTKGNEMQKVPDAPIVFSTPFIPGMTLLQLLEKFGGPTPLSDAEKSFIKRTSTGERINVNVKQLWTSRSSNLDVRLEAQDHIIVPMIPLVVIVAGQVNISGVFPYNSSSIVSDYIKLAGGINVEKGDPYGIYFIDKTGARTHVSMEQEVPPGSLIWVDKNSWQKTVFALDQIGVVIAFVASITALAASITSIYSDLK